MKTDRNDNKKHIDTCKNTFTLYRCICVYVFKIAPVL